MFTMLLGLMLANPLKKDVIEPATYHFAITIYRGNPDGSREKGDIEILSKPQIVTRSQQQALISVCQHVPIITDVKKQVGKKTTTVTDMQNGIILKLLPKSQEDGSVFISGDLSISKAVSESSMLVQTLSFYQLFQPGESRLITFYNPNDYLEQVGNLFGTFTRKKPYSGKEMWMEIKVVEPSTFPGATPLLQAEKPNSP